MNLSNNRFYFTEDWQFIQLVASNYRNTQMIFIKLHIKCLDTVANEQIKIDLKVCSNKNVRYLVNLTRDVLQTQKMIYYNEKSWQNRHIILALKAQQQIKSYYFQVIKQTKKLQNLKNNEETNAKLNMFIYISQTPTFCVEVCINKMFIFFVKAYRKGQEDYLKQMLTSKMCQKLKLRQQWVSLQICETNCLKNLKKYEVNKIEGRFQFKVFLTQCNVKKWIYGSDFMERSKLSDMFDKYACDIKCPISHQISKFPVRISGCHHSFDYCNIVIWLQMEKTCPICRNTSLSTNLEVDSMLLGKIKNVLVLFKPSRIL